MAALSVRNLDDQVRQRLRLRAARNGRSMESEVRAILIEAVSDTSAEDGLFVMLLDRFSEIGGVELPLLPRATPVRRADLSA